MVKDNKTHAEKWMMTISGKVQNVGYRFCTKSTADLLGISGWVRNLAQGDVQVCAVGTKDRLEKFARWCNVGPKDARVEKVQIEKMKMLQGAEKYHGFDIRDTKG